MQPCGRCGGNNVDAHHVRSEHCEGIRCEATRGMVHGSGTPFSRAASGATVLRGMRVTETLMYSAWRFCFTFFETVEGGRVHSCFKKSSRLAKRNNCALPGGSLISASLRSFHVGLISVNRGSP